MEKRKTKMPKNREEIEDKGITKEILADDDIRENMSFDDMGYLDDEGLAKMWKAHMEDF